MLAQEMVIMEADTRADPVPSALHIEQKIQSVPTHIHRLH